MSTVLISRELCHAMLFCLQAFVLITLAQILVSLGLPNPLSSRDWFYTLYVCHTGLLVQGCFLTKYNLLEDRDLNMFMIISLLPGMKPGI